MRRTDEGHSRGGWRGPAYVLSFAVAYYLLARLSYLAFPYDKGLPLAAWWAPSGLALAAIVRAHKRLLPWFVVTIFVVSWLTNFRQPILVEDVYVRSVADVVEPLVGGLLLRRLFGRGMSLHSLKEVTGFALIGGLVGPTAGALVAGIGTLVITPSPFDAVLRMTFVWWGSAVLGATLFTPLFLTWRRRPKLYHGLRLLEAFALALALGLLAGSAFIIRDEHVSELLSGFAAFPLFAWAATRFGTTGAARATVALSLLSVSPSLAVELEHRAWEMTAVQGIYALGAITALMLAALNAEMRMFRARAEAHANRAEESLALLESALRSAPFGIAFFDRSLRLTRVNDVFASLCGEAAEDLVGRTLDRALPAAAPRLSPVLRTVLSGETVTDTDLETNDGVKRSWLCSAFPVWARTTRPFGAGMLMVDVTERRAVEQDRTRLLREAKEAVRVREDFLSIASHELKTPLTPLAARLAFIQRKLAAGEAIAPESIEKPLQSLRRLTDLINDLLDASRIEHGRLMLHREPQVFEEIVRHTAEPFRGASPIHRIEVDTPDQPVWVNADPQRMSQVVANLIDNAIKYSPSGGTVRVRVRPHQDGVELTVADDGIGIPPEQQDRLFERFYRATNAGVSYGGLGLGLYITRDIVERHGGRIWAESTPDLGSTFHVVLPRLPAEEVRAALH